MFQSVRVERVNVLPDNQQAMIEFQADGAVVYYLLEADITETGAEALQAVMTVAREAYHKAWELPVLVGSGALGGKDSTPEDAIRALIQRSAQGLRAP